MKITAVLYKGRNYYRMIQRLWAKESKLQIAPLEISPELQKLGVKIHDALDIARDPNSYDVETGPSELIHQSTPPPKFYLFNEKIRTTETENQALCLTKTVSYPGLPSVLKSLVGIDQLPNQEQLVQRCIAQALIHDSQIMKLPRIVDIQRPSWKYPREFGIRYNRKITAMTKKLSLLCDMGCGKYPESLKRHKIFQPFSEVVVQKDEDTIVFQINGDILITSQKPLKPFASPSDVEATKEIELPSIYPIKPTLDLDQSEVSPSKRLDDIHLSELKDVSPYHVHTLHIAHKSFGFWFPYQKLSRAIVSCFTYAAEEARRLYGDDVKQLPQPVSIQCIFSDITNVGVLAYQLNTLDFSSSDGIKNQVWIENSEEMFQMDKEKILWQINAIKDYNDTVFSKMLAVYLNGVHPSSI